MRGDFQVSYIKSILSNPNNATTPTIIPSTIVSLKIAAAFRYRPVELAAGHRRRARLRAPLPRLPAHRRPVPGVAYTAPYLALLLHIPLATEHLALVAFGALDFALGAGRRRPKDLSVSEQQKGGGGFEIGGGLRVNYKHLELKALVRLESLNASFTGVAALPGIASQYQPSNVTLDDRYIGILTTLAGCSEGGGVSLWGMPGKRSLLTRRLELTRSTQVGPRPEDGDSQGLARALPGPPPSPRAFVEMVFRAGHLGPHSVDLDLSETPHCSPENLAALFLRMPRLVRLTLERCGLRTLPRELGRLLDLQELQARAQPPRPGAAADLRPRVAEVPRPQPQRHRRLPQGYRPARPLRYLNLGSNRAIHLDPGLGRCHNLRVLKLGHNLLRELPGELGDLAQLQILEADHNHLRGLPEALGNLVDLRSLILAGNALDRLPEAIGELTCLRSLDVADNQLVALPDAFPRLAALKRLDLTGNRIRTAPPALALMPQLESVRIATAPTTPFPRRAPSWRQI